MEKSVYEAETFIQVAADCPTEVGIIPTSTRVPAPWHVIQYEMLARRPYHYTFEDVLLTTHALRAGLLDHVDDIVNPIDWEPHRAFRDELFSRPHACFRASALGKKYGWGFHIDARGKAALVGRETPEYQQFASGDRQVPVLTTALRSKRVRE